MDLQRTLPGSPLNGRFALPIPVLTLRGFVHACLLSITILVSACGGVGVKRQLDETSVTASKSKPALMLVQDAAKISGEWDIVSFEGYKPRRLNGTTRDAFADFSASGVSLQIECNHSGRQGNVKEGRFVLSPESDTIQTVVGCGREREDRDARYFTFFDKSPTVELQNDGRLRLSADGRELILERPSVRRSPKR